MSRQALPIVLVFVVLFVSAATLMQAQEEEEEEDGTSVPATVGPGQQRIDIPRIEENGRLLIAMRSIFEALGWTVDWQGGSQTIDARLHDILMVLQIDNRLAVLNGKQHHLDVPPRLINDTTFVPLRFVAEATGCQVDYLGDRVKITGVDNATVLMVYLNDVDS